MSFQTPLTPEVNEPASLFNVKASDIGGLIGAVSLGVFFGNSFYILMGYTSLLIIYKRFFESEALPAMPIHATWRAGVLPIPKTQTIRGAHQKRWFS